MIELFVSSLITFFVVIDPPGCAPIYAGLSAGATSAHRRAMAVRAVVVAALILLVFAMFGEALLHGLGVATDVVEASARAWIRIQNMIVAGMGAERRQGEFAPGRI